MKADADSLFEQCTPEPTTGCWLWTRATNFENGYGVLYIGGGRANAKKILATHAMYIATKGPIPQGMHLCHKCDTPSCINPDHLFLGTPSDNALDAVRKRRHFQSKREFCVHGHPCVESNIMKFSQGSKHRFCRLCHNRRNRIYRAKLRAKANPPSWLKSIPKA